MFCQKCGAEGVEGGFCQKCGEKLGGVPNQANTTFQQPPQQPTYQPQYQQQVVNNGARCPKCGGIGRKSFKTWQIVIAILFFPIGLVALCIPKENKCQNCKTWF